MASGRTARAGAVWVAAAVAGAEHLGTLVLHGRGTELREVEHRTLERGAVVTALVLLFARSVAEAEERLGGELLADLVDGAADPLLLRERLRRHGVALGDRPLVVAAASAGPDGRAALHRGAVRIARAERGLAAEHAGAVVLLAPGADAVDVGRRLRDAVEAADAGSGRVTVGVAVADGELPPAYADARRCLDVLLTLGRQGDVSDQAGLGVARLLLGTSGPDELAAFVDRTLGPVLAWDERRGPRCGPPSTPGSPPAARSGRRPSGCTCTPTPSSSGSTGSASCSDPRGGSRGGRWTSSSPCGWCSSRRRGSSDEHVATPDVAAAHMVSAVRRCLRSSACLRPRSPRSPGAMPG